MNVATPTIYVIDTCSLVAITDNHPKHEAHICRGLEALINAGRLKSVPQVLEELKKDSHTRVFILKHKHQLIVPDAELFPYVGTIAKQFISLIGIHTAKDKADPWLLALAQQLDAPLVSEEKKIHNACRVLGLTPLRLARLLAVENLLPVGPDHS